MNQNSTNLNTKKYTLKLIFPKFSTFLSIFIIILAIFLTSREVA